METKENNKVYLNWHDFAEMFECGRSKALLLMHAVGVVYIGNIAFVPAKKLEEHLEKHGSIDIRWPSPSKKVRRGNGR